MAEPGVVDHRFEVLTFAGQGAMGRVYRALDQETNKLVALKILRSDVDAGVRFERETTMLASLDHRTIVRYVAHGHSPDGAYLAMEWLEGEDLRARLKRERLGVLETLIVATRTAAALAHVHSRGLVHRDVKPSNLLLVNNELERTTLIDFGLARSAGADEETETGMLVGTPGYMAPEQIRGEDLTGVADVFALGCLVFRCLTGIGPFTAKGITAVLARVLYEAPALLVELVPDIPSTLGDLVDAMLAKSPTDRPTMTQTLDVLARMRGSLSKHPPAAAHVEALSAREQRIVSVLVAGTVDAGDEDATLRRAPSPADVDLVRLRAVAARFDADLSLLPNGALVAVLKTKGTATDLARRAAQCALALELRLHDVPMALATGRAELGAMPGGEAIDRATAMLARGAPNTVVVDDVTAGLLDARFEVATSTGTHVLVRERSALDAPRTLLGRRTTSVGRANDLARLVDTFEDALESSAAHVTLVLGPAGIGKSRLRHELTSEVQGQADVWIARGDPMRTASPFGILAPMLRSLMGILEGEPKAMRWEKLERAVQSRFDAARKVAWPLPPREDAARIATFLGEMLSIPLDAPMAHLEAARRDPVLHADQTRRAFCDFVALSLAARPLVIVLEDLHWADAPSVLCITDALRTLARSPLNVVALARPDVSERFKDLWLAQGVRTMRLSPLAAWAGVKLVRQLLRDTADADAERLVAQADGNPFYLEELIRARAEGRSDRTPETIVAMAQARLESIEPVERRVLRAASIVGAAFWEGLVATLVGDQLSREGLRHTLRRLVERELIVWHGEGRFPGDEEYAFRHALMREAAYSLLTDDDRSRGHRITAEWLRDAGELDSLVLAEHFERSGDLHEAGPLYVAAARAALEASDTDGALARTRSAERCGVTGPDFAALRAIQAIAYRYHGDVALAVSMGLEAVKLLPVDSPDWTDALACVAVNAAASGSSDVLEQLLALVRAMFARGITPRGGVAAALSVETFSHAGRGSVAQEVLDSLTSRPALLDDPICRATIFYAKAVRVLLTNISEACELLTKSVAAHEEAGNLRGASASRMNLGYTYLMLGQYELAEEMLRSTRATRVGLGVNVMVVDHNLGLALARLGKNDEALEAELRALDAAKAAGSHMFEGFCRLYLSKIHRARNELPFAEREARASTDLLRAIPGGLAAAYGELAIGLLEQGRDAEALEPASKGMKIRDEIGPLDEGDILLQVAHGEALAATGDTDGARARAKLVKEAVRERGANIADETARARFLRDVPENARAVAFTARFG